MRPQFIKHYSEIQDPPGKYETSDELFSIGSPFAKVFGLKKLGIHHELLHPGRRTSFPHAESAEEEFVYVIEGQSRRLDRRKTLPTQSRRWRWVPRGHRNLSYLHQQHR